MANLQKHRAHESLNMDSAAIWSESANSNSVAGTQSINVSGYHTIHFQITEDIYINFTTISTTTIDTAHALYLRGGDTIYSLKIPTGLGNTVYFQHARMTADGEVHYVLA